MNEEPEEEIDDTWWNSDAAQIIAWGICWFLVLVGMGTCSHLSNHSEPLIHIETKSEP